MWLRLWGYTVSQFRLFQIEIRVSLIDSGENYMRRWVIQIFEDMLQSCMIDFKGSWEDHLPLAEFAYNNSFQYSIQMALYKALYYWKYQTPLCWIKLGERRILGPKLVFETKNTIWLIRDRLQVASDRQKSYTNLKKERVWVLYRWSGILKGVTVEESFPVWAKGEIEFEIHRALSNFETSWTNCVPAWVTTWAQSNSWCVSRFNVTKVSIWSFPRRSNVRDQG